MTPITPIERLRAARDIARVALENAEAAYRQALVDASPFKIGDFYVSNLRGRCQISLIYANYDHVTVRGRLCRRDGSVGVRQTTIYSSDNWRKEAGPVI